MNGRRALTTCVPFLKMTYEGDQTINNVCKCCSLDDLVRVWDVRWTIPPPTQRRASIRKDGDTTGGDDAGIMADDVPHNYGDRSFLDHDAFRRERSERDVLVVVTAAETESAGPRPTDAMSNGEDRNKKKTEEGDGCDIASSLGALKQSKVMQ